MSVERLRRGNWHIAVRHMSERRLGWVAWAMRVPTTANVPTAEPSHLDTYFEFGDNRDEAIDNLISSLPPA